MISNGESLSPEEDVRKLASFVLVGQPRGSAATAKDRGLSLDPFTRFAILKIVVYQMLLNKEGEMVFSDRNPNRVEKLSQKEIDELIKRMGGKEKILYDLARFRRDCEFIEYHHEELLKKYPNEWIAVYDVEVVDTDKDFLALLGRLKRKGLPTNKMVIRFMDTDPKPLILTLQGAAV